MTPSNDQAAATAAAGVAVYRDTHITTYFSEKLSKTGYDRKREQVRAGAGAGGEKPVRFRNKEKEKELEKQKLREQHQQQPLATF
jgi:hypothetical protein